MKKASIFLLLLLAVSACKRDNSAIISANVTTAEAVEIAASTIAASNNGFAATALDVANAAQTVYNLKLNCGGAKSITVSNKSPANATITYAYDLTYVYTSNCNTNNLIDNITGTATGNGSFDGPRLSAIHTANTTFRVAGFAPASLVYIIDADYHRTGTFALKTGTRVTGNTIVDISISNYTMRKDTKEITSGLGTFSTSGTTDNGGKFNFSGNITYANNGTATLNINGTSYIVNLASGVVTKK